MRTRLQSSASLPLLTVQLAASDATSFVRTGSQLAEVMDSLITTAEKSPERAGSMTGIKEAQERWLEADRTRKPSLAKKRFDVLRARLAVFVVMEDARYASGWSGKRTMLLVTSGAIMLEMLALLLVMNSMIRDLLMQATQVLEQKESLERQALELEQFESRARRGD